MFHINGSHRWRVYQICSDRWIVYTKSRKQLLHRKYLLYETGCICTDESCFKQNRISKRRNINELLMHYEWWHHFALLCQHKFNHIFFWQISWKFFLHIKEQNFFILTTLSNFIQNDFILNYINLHLIMFSRFQTFFDLPFGLKGMKGVYTRKCI